MTNYMDDPPTVKLLQKLELRKNNIIKIETVDGISRVLEYDPEDDPYYFELIRDTGFILRSKDRKIEYTIEYTSLSRPDPNFKLLEGTGGNRQFIGNIKRISMEPMGRKISLIGPKVKVEGEEDIEDEIEEIHLSSSSEKWDRGLPRPTPRPVWLSEFGSARFWRKVAKRRTRWGQRRVTRFYKIYKESFQ